MWVTVYTGVRNSLLERNFQFVIEFRIAAFC